MRLLEERIRNISGSTGTGDVVLGTADTACRSLAVLSPSVGDVFDYLIEDGAAWETGRGTITVLSPLTFERTMISNSSSDGEKISLTGDSEKVSLIASREFYARIYAEVVDRSIAPIELTLASSLSVPSGTPTKIPFTTASTCLWNSTTNRLEGVDGYPSVKFRVCLQWSDNSVGYRYLEVRVNGALYLYRPEHQRVAACGETTQDLITEPITVGPTDYVEFFVTQNSGSTLTLLATPEAERHKNVALMTEFLVGV